MHPEAGSLIEYNRHGPGLSHQVQLEPPSGTGPASLLGVLGVGTVGQAREKGEQGGLSGGREPSRPGWGTGSSKQVFLPAWSLCKGRKMSLGWAGKDSRQNRASQGGAQRAGGLAAGRVCMAAPQGCWKGRRLVREHSTMARGGGEVPRGGG